MLGGIRVTANLIPADETDFKDYLIWGIKMTVTLIPLPENPYPGSTHGFASIKRIRELRILSPELLIELVVDGEGALAQQGID
jgi:hypothetical protein